MSIQYISSPVFYFKSGGSSKKGNLGQYISKVTTRLSEKAKQIASSAKQLAAKANRTTKATNTATNAATNTATNAASTANAATNTATNAASTANAAANAAANATSTANAAANTAANAAAATQAVAQQVSRLGGMYDKLKSFMPGFISNHPVGTAVIGSSTAGFGLGAALFGGGKSSTPQQSYAMINGVKVPITKGDDGVFVVSSDTPTNDLDAAVAEAMGETPSQQQDPNTPQQQQDPNTPQQQQGTIGNQPLDMNNINYQSPYINQPQIDYSQIDIEAVNDLFDDDQW